MGLSLKRGTNNANMRIVGRDFSDKIRIRMTYSGNIGHNMLTNWEPCIRNDLYSSA